MKGKKMMKGMPMKGAEKDHGMMQLKSMGCDMMKEMKAIAKGKMKPKGTQLHKGMK